MEKNDAVVALSGLAHLTRLDIFRLLVEAGPAGMSAGQIGERLGLAPATLSFHLKDLKQAGLIDCQRESRSLIYSADFGQIRALVAYLTEQCCQGRPEVCGLPGCAAEAAVPNSSLKGRTRHELLPRARRR
jgi:DNA-binding transcriptional ArsR family regulator